MEYWIIQIKPFSPKKRNENIVLNFQKDCIRNNLFGMGWNIDDNAYPAGEPMPDYEEYQQKWPALVTFPKQHITPIRTFRQEILCFSEIETPNIILQK